MGPLRQDGRWPFRKETRYVQFHGNMVLDDVDGLEVDYLNLRKFARAAQEFAVFHGLQRQ